MTDIERVEKATREIRAHVDPAPTPEEQIGRKADDLIDQITDHVIGELRVMRDRLDDLMRALLSRRDGLKDGVREQVELASQAVKLKDIAQEAIDRLTTSVETGLPSPGKRKAITNGKG